MSSLFGLVAFCLIAVASATLPLHVSLELYEKIQITQYSEQAPDPNLMKCAAIGFFLEKCVEFSHLPRCNGNKSEFQVCLDKINSALPQCKINLLSTALKQKISILQASDKILCQTGLYKDFRKNIKCWLLGKAGMTGISGLVNGLLTDNGCKIAKMNRDIIIGLGSKIPKCTNQLTTYLTPLFKQSACGSVKEL